MLHLSFITQSPEHEKAALEYSSIWQKDGGRMCSTLHMRSGLSFTEKSIDVIIYEGMSFAGKSEVEPMRLRASYPTTTKRATLIHELSHRLLFHVQDYHGLDEHQVIYLFLYDTWVDLYGREFADEQVRIESARKGFYDYEKAWQWALDKSEHERAQLVNRILIS